MFVFLRCCWELKVENVYMFGFLFRIFIKMLFIDKIIDKSSMKKLKLDRREGRVSCFMLYFSRSIVKNKT